MIHLLMFIVPLIVDAAPSPTRTVPLQPRASTSPSSDTSSGLSVQVWAPLVAIAVVILAMILFTCVKRSRMNPVSAISGITGTQLTAAQLHGGSASTGTATETGSAARRARRNRRTASQISTRSLPAYMEDPGDSEMVLARATEPMQDPMPSVPEDNIATEDNPQYNSSMASTTDFNASVNSRTHLINSPSTESNTRESYDTARIGSDDSSHGLLNPTRGHSRQPSAEEIQAMGDTPSYDEAVDNNMEMTDVRAPSASLSVETESTRSGSTRATRRRSGLRSLTARFSSMLSGSSPPSPSVSAPPVPLPTPVSPAPTQPVRNSPRTAPTARSPSISLHTRHRTGTSASGSSLNLTQILTNNRSVRSILSNPSSSQLPLTSPSTISLGTISAPLHHTLTRTAFVYPQSGPTTEQMRFISSRERMGTLGVPYGTAAEAFAAAVSDEALAVAAANSGEAPPPFDLDAADHPGMHDGDDNDNVDDEDDVETGEQTPLVTERPPLPFHALNGETIPKSPRPSTRSRDSVGTFQTARERFFPETETEHAQESEDLEVVHIPVAEEADGVQEHTSRSVTPTPNPGTNPVTPETDATKSVPTPPPTPPRQPTPSYVLPTLDIPNIAIFSPVSPSSTNTHR
ncbi:hypothetical protein K439DRAFT_339384 [Ramaria rubella]|nr:hypothetical protein K439DRAFT_339384 [Ramaria rubella]